MKKFCLLIAFCVFSFFSQAQDISYGFVLGVNGYDVETKGGAFTADTAPQYGINLGVFGDYNFTPHFGIKSDLFYTSNEEGYRIKSTILRFDNKVAYVQLSPKLKYSVSNNYQKGFYILLGPRMSILVSAKDEDDSDIKDFYKGSNFGLQFGFGTTMLKYFAIEAVMDYGLGDTSEGNTETKTFGGFVNLNINLESIINN